MLNIIMETLQEIKNALDDFLKYVPALSQLSPEGPWFMPIDWDKKVSFPNAELPGVYFFQNNEGNLIYIGKASNGLGERIGSGYIGQGGKIKDSKIADASQLYTIGLPKDLFFIAPAIEEFLIFKLDPKGNTIGRLRNRF
jgi:GIY-YIG catalytic domain